MKKKTTKTTKSTKKTKKMPPKTPKTTDVATPHKAPSVTSRPIVVTNRSFIANDPMLVDTAKKADPDSSVAMTHRTARTIQPMTGGSQPAAPAEIPAVPASSSVLMPPEIPGIQPEKAPVLAPSENSSPTTAAATTVDVSASTPSPEITPPVDTSESSPPPEVTKSNEPETKPEPEAPATSGASVEEEADDEAKKVDAEIEAQAAEEAKQQKLEGLIASGAYTVPINAVQRKRSRMFVAVMCIFAVLLLLVLLDALLDVGLFKLPSVVPHTHFFSNI